MSYNIDHVETTVLKGWMRAKDVVSLYDNHEGSLPEATFLEELYDRATGLCKQGDGNDKLNLPNLWWYGEGSGWSWDLLKETVAPKIGGHVEAIFTWEGGDSETALVIKDGKVREGSVKKLITPKAKPKKKRRTTCPESGR